MKTAYIGLRDSPHYRRDIFADGLRAHGFAIEFKLCSYPNPDDVLVIWNRYGAFDACAKRCESVGAKVFVAENAYLGQEILGGGSKWLALAKSHHVGAGEWPVGSDDRWDQLGVKLKPFREDGREIVVLKQRGIGEPGIAMPRDWRADGRVRRHPGKLTASVPLERDLERAKAVVTWASGAALKALLWGIPVITHFPRWIGASASCAPGEPLNRSESARLSMLRRMIWAQWRREEIASGEAFAALFGATHGI